MQGSFSNLLTDMCIKSIKIAIENRCCPVSLLHKRVESGNTMIKVMIFIFLFYTLPTSIILFFQSGHAVDTKIL